MIYTSFEMAEKEGATYDGCEGFAKLMDSVGDRKSYQGGIPLDVVLSHAGLREALWALRAVHPEQATLASRVARKWCLVAAQSATGKMNGEAYGSEFLRRSLDVSADYILGLATRGDLDFARRMVWDRCMKFDRRDRFMPMLVWLALAKNPERIAADALDCFWVAVSDELDPKEATVHRKMLEVTFRKLVRGNGPACEGPGLGPIVKPSKAPERKPRITKSTLRDTLKGV